MRPVLAALAGATAAAVGAVILGEYNLTGVMGVGAGALFGLAVGEVVLIVGGPEAGGAWAAPLAAAITAGGVAWAAWISAGRDWGFVPGTAWIGLAVGAALAAVWVRTGARRSSRTPGG